MWQLRVKTGIGGLPAGVCFPLAAGLTRVGRDPSNEIALEDASVSSRHAEIEAGPAGCTVRDLGSTNGTTIDALAVECAPVAAGQTLTFGQAEFVLETDSPAPPAIPLPVPPPIRAELARATPGPRQAKPASGKPTTPADLRSALYQAFAYPIVRDSLIMLLVGAIFFAATGWIGRFVGILALVCSAYLISYFPHIVQASAQGDPDLPPWPDFNFQDLASSLFRFIATCLLSFGPASLVRAMGGEGNPVTQVGYLALLLIGSLYFPMAYLSVCLHDSLAGLNPVFCFGSIAKRSGDYLQMWILAVGVALGSYAVESVLVRLRVPLITGLVATFVQLYSTFVMMRLFGVFYWCNRLHLRWFNERS